jgi:hypothetical protein
MFIFNKHTNSWSNWIGKFGQDFVEVALSIDSEHPVVWEKKISPCRIRIHCVPYTDGSFTNLPNEVLDQMKKYLGTALTKFLVEFQMRSIDYYELKRESAASTGIRLYDLSNFKRCLMLPKPNYNDQLTQEYIGLGFEED